MNKPSTDWREKVAPDEAERFASYARDLLEIQNRASAKHGPGRALHRLQILALPAHFEVLGGLPEHARHGLFAQPGRHDALIRLSNGSAQPAPDRKPDVRGFSFLVKGVRGPAALGGETDSQHFTLINKPAFAFPTSDEFIGFVKAFARSPLALPGYLFGRYGLFGGLKQIRRLGALLSTPFLGFASDTFYSAAPIACGPYAVRLRLLPAQPEPAAKVDDGWAGDMLARLDKGPLSYDFQLQFFVNETQTPIEDASVNWTEDVAPYVTVARLVIPHRKEWAAQHEVLQKQMESGVVDSWRALAVHRPLGDVMRARKVIYFESQKNRGAR